MPSEHSAARTLTRFTLVAACIMLLAPSSAVAQSPSKLQSLVNDAAAQFKIAYRQNTAEHRARYEQLSKALAGWKASPRSEENDRLLADWLRGAIRRSMPGSREPLPPLPEFQRPVDERIPAPRQDADKLIGDPFGDDPIDDVE